MSNSFYLFGQIQTSQTGGDTSAEGEFSMGTAWSSLEEGGEGSCRANSHSNLDILLGERSILF